MHVASADRRATPILGLFGEPDCWDCHVGFPTLILLRGASPFISTLPPKPRWLFSGCNEMEEENSCVSNIRHPNPVHEYMFMIDVIDDLAIPC